MATDSSFVQAVELTESLFTFAAIHLLAEDKDGTWINRYTSVTYGRMPTVADRALQRSASQVLSAIYEQDFLSCSFGGRPGRGAHQALATLHERIAGGKIEWVLEADLEVALAEKRQVDAVSDRAMSCFVRVQMIAAVVGRQESGGVSGVVCHLILINHSVAAAALVPDETIEALAGDLFRRCPVAGALERCEG